MEKILNLVISAMMAALLLGAGGCTAIGAGVGGVAGAAATHGNPAGTVGGAVVGGVIGNHL
jgi:osmotically inducible lipoprotein OsmB